MVILADLPIEILEHILSFLPLDAWKQASLVCRQWTSVCSARKCMANVVLRLEPDEQGAAEICGRLSSSDRKYRHVLYKSNDDESDVLPTILGRFKPSLESLRITGYYESVMELSLDYLKRLFECLTMLKELRIQTMIAYDDDDVEVPAKVHLAKMPYLRVLYLECESLEAACFDWRKIAPNLKHLYITHNAACKDFYGLMSFYRQQLCSLGVYLSGAQYFSVGKAHVKFPHVRQLTLCYWTPDEFDRTARLLKSFSNLLELTLGHYVSPETLTLIVNSFSSLVTLRLFGAMPENGLQIISKLPSLKELFLFRVTLNHIQLAQADSFKSLEQLAFKDVEVGDVDNFFPLVHIKMPKITSLETIETDEHHTLAACKYLGNLQRLNIIYFESGMLCDHFGELSRLTQLLELRLNHYGHQSEFSWSWFPHCPSIRNLRISLQQLTQFCSTAENEATEWKAFADSFPALAKLEIAKCNLPPSTVELIRTHLPNCDIRHVSKKKPFQADSVDGTLQFSESI